MDNSLKGLLLAAGVVITCVVLGLGFYVSRQSKSTAMDAMGNVDKMNIEFSESAVTIYDGASISGTEVLSIIDKYKNSTDFGVKVVNKKGTVYYGMNLADTDTAIGTAGTRVLTNAKSTTHNDYINTNASFKGDIFRDTNNTIIGMSFTQQ